MIAGSDGNLWFTERFGDSPGMGKIGRITPAGQITHFDIPEIGDYVSELVAGANGATWFVQVPTTISDDQQIYLGRITRTGEMTKFPISVSHISLGPDGNIWFTEVAGKIGRMTPAGKITEFSLPNANTALSQIIAASDGAFWFTEAAGKIGRITPAGKITEFPALKSGRAPRQLFAGSSGKLWFIACPPSANAVECAGGTLGRLLTSGQLTEYSLPKTYNREIGTVIGPDGNFWFTKCTYNSSTEQCSGWKLARITPSGTVSEHSLSSPSLVNLAGTEKYLWFTECTYNSTTGQSSGWKLGRVTPVN
jgi:virginiamycin B lyase